MRVAIAPNAFRGSLSAFQAALCIAEGLSQSRLSVEPILMPLADGGDGTLDVVYRGLGGEKLTLTVTGPDGKPTTAQLGLMSDGQTAIVELAQASGIEKLPRDKRNALHTTTYGTGELIRAAVERGYHRILVGLGGSATNDGGAGAMQALGAKLLDTDGNEIAPGGAALANLARVDASAVKRLLHDTELIALCDVDNPLTGHHGASRVFGPQKGASEDDIQLLDAALAHYAMILKRDIGRDVLTIPGGGAAGGIAAGMVAFADAEIAPGAETLIRLLAYEELLENADLLITGEGKLDAQTMGGKAVRTIADAAMRRELPVIALVGILDCTNDDLRAMNIDAAYSIVTGPCRIQDAIENAAAWLTLTAAQVGNTLAIQRA
jgi:glycerate 2-kinase